jgi:hypothetical protein
MRDFQDWKGDPLPVRFSRGKSKVPYVEDWDRNVVGAGGADGWPEFLLRQVRAYVSRPTWFADDDAVALSARLGRISKFQSLRSEDALTWSWFGTLHGPALQSRRASLQWLCARFGLNVEVSDEVAVHQWLRVPHPNVAGRLGPEVDAVVDDPHGVLVYVEAKWEAELGTGKGGSEGALDDQIVLRCKALNADRLDADRPRIVLGVSRARPDLGVYDSVARDTGVAVHWLTWTELASCNEHPRALEFREYLAWRARLSK